MLLCLLCPPRRTAGGVLDLSAGSPRNRGIPLPDNLWLLLARAGKRRFSALLPRVGTRPLPSASSQRSQLVITGPIDK